MGWAASAAATVAAGRGPAERTPTASHTVSSTDVPGPAMDRSTNTMRRGSRRTTSIASRVFPAPPGPVTVTSRCPRTRSPTRSTSSSRPTKLPSGVGSR